MARSVILLFDPVLPASSQPAALLRAAGFEVLEARAEHELEQLATIPAAIVLGGWMPGEETVGVVRRLRARGWQQPILLRGKPDSLDECVAVLAAGANDFACCDAALAARVTVLLHRAPAADPFLARWGEIVVDSRRRTVSVAGRRVRLSQLEAEFLAVLARAEGRPVRREDLLREVWQCSDDARTRTIETHVWRLRKKLGDDAAEPRWLLSHAGVGYSLAHEKPAIV